MAISSQSQKPSYTGITMISKFPLIALLPALTPAAPTGAIQPGTTGWPAEHVGGTAPPLPRDNPAYGDAGTPPTIPAKPDLTFASDLVPMPDTPPVPKAPQAPPANPSAAPTKPA